MNKFNFILENFVQSGHEFNVDEFYLESTYHAANITLLVLISIGCILSIVHISIENLIYAQINLVLSSISLVCIVFLRLFSKKYFYHLSAIAFIVFFLLILFSFFSDITLFPLAAWFLIFIFSTFFIFNNIFIFIHILFFSIVSIVLLFKPETNISFQYIVNFSSPVLVGYVILYFYNKRTKILFDKLNESNEYLEMKINKETKSRTQILENEKNNLEFLANHDYLTGLPNMSYFEKIVEEKMHTSISEEKPLSIIYIDLNKFKYINDIYGHAIGNKVLKIISKRLQDILSKNDFLARVGGDEFLIVSESMPNEKALKKDIIQYLNNIEKNINLDGLLLSVNASIGISFYPVHSRVLSELIVYADKAMRELKQKKNAPYKIYKEDINILGYDKSLLEKEIDIALCDEDFLLYYQPQVDVKSEKIVGLEALVRWNHPILGILEPRFFLELVNNIGAMNRLEYFVIKKAMTIATKLHEEANFNFKIAININVQTLEAEDFLDFVKLSLEQTSCKGEWIEFEITETELIANIDKAIISFNGLKLMDISIAIDDFGTGYSSLSYLTQLPIDKIKIDKIFVDSLLDNNCNVSIIKAIIAIAQSFNFDVVIEGVENKQQLECLKTYDVETIQGYYYYRPMQYDDLCSTLRDCKIEVKSIY